MHVTLLVGTVLAISVAAAAPQDACLKGPFHKITPTSETGAITGPVDRNDWGCLGGAAGVPPAGPDGVPVPPPTATCMTEAYPNPTHGAVVLGFTLPAATHAVLKVYGESAGHGPRQVVVERALLEGDLQGGAYRVTWDLLDDHGARVPAGIYRAVLSVPQGTLCGDIEVR
jgi:hypothetical protein